MVGSSFSIAGALNPNTGLPEELQTITDYVVSGGQCLIPTGIPGENVSVKIPRPYEPVKAPMVIPPMVSTQIKAFDLEDVEGIATRGMTLAMNLIDNADVAKAQQEVKETGNTKTAAIFFRTALKLLEKYKDHGVWIGTGPDVNEAIKNYQPEKPKTKPAKTASAISPNYQRRVDRTEHPAEDPFPAPRYEPMPQQPVAITHPVSQQLTPPAPVINLPPLTGKPVGSLFFKSAQGFEGRIPYLWLNANEDYSGESTMLAILVDGREETPMMLPPRSDQQILGLSWYAVPGDKKSYKVSQALLIHAPTRFGDMDLVVFSLLSEDPPEDEGA